MSRDTITRTIRPATHTSVKAKGWTGDRATRHEGARVLYLRDGKVTRLVACGNQDRALANLSLGSQGDPA
jgi:hypothetical protein